MADLIAANITVVTGAQTLVDNASLRLTSGELIAIVGENGAGKSTLMRAMAGYIAYEGNCQIDGTDIRELRPAARARQIAWLPQNVPLAWPIRVIDAVALGRFAHGGLPHRLTTADEIAVRRALSVCGLAHLTDRSTANLSGGELARVHIARALAAETPLLLADEPVAALDPRYRLAIMDIFRKAADNGCGVMVILHDLGLAARFADRIIGLKAGKIIIDDCPEKAITPHNILRLFGVEARVENSAGWPNPVIIGPVAERD